MSTRWSQNIAFVVLGVAACQLSSCYTQSIGGRDTQPYPVRAVMHPFSLKVGQHFYPGGASMSYYLTYDTVAVEGTNPFARRTVELYSRHLEPEESERWMAFIETFPLDELETRYADLNVYDGFSRHFVFHTGFEEKEISVRNVRVETLWDLCREIDTLIPEELAIGTMHPSVADRLRDLQSLD